MALLDQVIEACESRVGVTLRKRPNHGHDEWYGPCPVCQQGKDRFSVWLGDDGFIRWDCHSCTIVKNQKNLLTTLGFDLSKLVDQPVVRRGPPPIPRVPDAGLYAGLRFGVETVERDAAKGFELALEWAMSFGLDEQDVRDFHLGYSSFWNHSKNGQYCGFTIPHFHYLSDGEIIVGGVRERKDTARGACEDMPKYWTWPTSKIGGAYGDDALCSPDLRRQGPALDAVFFGEDEKSMMVLRHMLREEKHLSAVAYSFYHDIYSWDYYMRKMCSNVTKLIYIQDNDDDKGNNDKGLTNALKFQKVMSPREVFIIKPPVSDMAEFSEKQGMDAAKQWLVSQPACINLF